MSERPIIMSGESVRGILEGRKTQTRRVIKEAHKYKQYTKWTYKPEVAENDGDDYVWLFSDDTEQFGWYDRCPYGKPGDLLWVRETFCKFGYNSFEDVLGTHHWVYKATARDWDISMMQNNGIRWKPSIHMPKSAARLWLRVKDVRVERVQDISEDDAECEGAEPILVPPDGGACPHVEGFMELWNSINAKRGYGWDVNPWAWVVEFEKADD